MHRLMKVVLLTAIFALPACTRAAEEKAGVDPGMVQIEQVEVRATMVGAVVLLKAEGKAIPVFVDGTVAESIAAALSGAKLNRPLSHNLMHTILEGFDGKVSRVVITLKGTTFYADLTVLLGGTTKVFDSRSSDAIALAVHFKAPVLVSRELLEKVGQVLDEPSPQTPGAPAGTRL
jgi:bifunctional DNase/RNase